MQPGVAWFWGWLFAASSTLDRTPNRSARSQARRGRDASFATTWSATLFYSPERSGTQLFILPQPPRLATTSTMPEAPKGVEFPSPVDGSRRTRGVPFAQDPTIVGDRKILAGSVSVFAAGLVSSGYDKVDSRNVSLLFQENDHLRLQEAASFRAIQQRQAWVLCFILPPPGHSDARRSATVGLATGCSKANRAGARTQGSASAWEQRPSPLTRQRAPCFSSVSSSPLDPHRPTGRTPSHWTASGAARRQGFP